MRGRAVRAGGVTSPSALSRAAWRVPIDRSRRDGAFWPGSRGFQGLSCRTVRQGTGGGKLAPRALGDVSIGPMHCFGVLWPKRSKGSEEGREREKERKRALYTETPRESFPSLVNSRVTASGPPLCYIGDRVEPFAHSILEDPGWIPRIPTLLEKRFPSRALMDPYGSLWLQERQSPCITVHPALS